MPTPGRIAAALVPALLLSLNAPAGASAQTDEIQVYEGTLAAKGTINLTLHDNYTPIGTEAPAFPGALVAHRSFNGVPEWAYGVTDWCEAGLYLPLYSVGRVGGIAARRSAMLDGVKLRLLLADPHAEARAFFYGVNLELSYNSKHWDSKRVTSELRPIVGWHLHPVDVVVNPILDTSYDGPGNLDFAPATRIAYNFSTEWATAIEEYDDFGPLRRFYAGSGQSHQLYGVLDHSGRKLDVEAGVGFGLTHASDKLTLKLILSRDLN